MLIAGRDEGNAFAEAEHRATQELALMNEIRIAIPLIGDLPKRPRGCDSRYTT